MTYHRHQKRPRPALGQMKLIPGQINFMSSPGGHYTYEQALVDYGYMGLGALGKGGGGGGGHGGHGSGHGGGHQGHHGGGRGRGGRWGGGWWYGPGWYPWYGGDYYDYGYLPPATPSYIVRCHGPGGVTEEPATSLEEALQAARQLTLLGTGVCQVYTSGGRLIGTATRTGFTYAAGLSGFGAKMRDYARRLFA